MWTYDHLSIYFSAHPKRLFILDAIGALCSAGMLGIVLVSLEPIFGIPSGVLYVLAAFPCLFAILDISVYLFISSKPQLSRSLKWIALANGLYCLLSLALTFRHYQAVQLAGWLYILLEVLIVLMLARLEWITASRLDKAS